MFNGELIVDNFAGGGGASTGIEQALNCKVDIAINHDAEALAMHAANHPDALHLCENVWQVDIKKVVAGRRIALAWFSPDCKHFSKAKGGTPVEKKIRGLAWIVLKWAGLPKHVRPRVIALENVEEFQTWCPLVNGRPCAKRKGMTFRRWVDQLRTLGYQVEWREMRACDYGAPTIRKRLFVLARCDGKKIVWPEPTHAPAESLFLQPYRTAAECIDWSIPCPSIFERERPLAENTMRRIARGIHRFVIDNPTPFIVNMAHGGRLEPVDEPFRTIATEKGGSRALITPFIARTAHSDTAKNGSKRWGKGEHSLEYPLPTMAAKGDFALVSPILVGAGGSEYQGKPKRADQPFNTVTTENHTALVTAFLAQHNTKSTGHPADAPLTTITAKGHQQRLVTSHLIRFKGTCKDGQPVDAPLGNIEAQGKHWGEVRAFLIKYYSTGGQDQAITDPMHTITAKARMGLVTIHGVDWQIVDIGMRMLTPRELFNAQGFPHDYIIAPVIDETGKILTKTSQTRMCGNSVSPPCAKAIIAANFRDEIGIQAAAQPLRLEAHA